MLENPFAVVTPEKLSAEQADQLFVEMHSDYPEITRPGNTLVTGARGCGKSMLIRCTLPDFLMIRHKQRFSELPYLSLCLSVKQTEMDLAELKKLDNLHIPYFINEHFLTLNVLVQSFHSLSEVHYETELYDVNAYKEFFDNVYSRFIRLSGCKDVIDVDYSTPNSFFSSLYQHLLSLSYSFIYDYLSGLLYVENANLSYRMPLFSYSRIIVPIFTKIVELPCFPNGKPVFLFIDAAENLSLTQTEVLNSWIASRTQPTISLKVFTQIGLYKTYLTSSGSLIESPHDYQELDISSKFTTQFNNTDYYDKIVSILIRRLRIAGYMPDIPVDDTRNSIEALKTFLPSYQKQDEGIEEEAQLIRKEYPVRGRGYQVSDDIKRYASPNYIRRLAGRQKSKPSYRYSGLDTIVALSSGIIRYLLDALASMYDDTANNKPINTDYFDDSGNVKYIPTEIQNKVLREKADFYLFNELPKSDIVTEDNRLSGLAITENPRSMTEKLTNLINAMGRTFQEILLSGTVDDPYSGRSERKVFSISLSNPENMSRELKEVFRLGVRLGFLHEAYIGNKAGNGRTYLFILNRCFAPIFTLDPSGSQHYLSMNNEDLTRAIYTGKKLREVDEGSPIYKALSQLTIDAYWED